ncbi:hypothetical protein ACTFIT_001474 [Dictyostelium discoideum]
MKIKIQKKKKNFYECLLNVFDKSIYSTIYIQVNVFSSLNPFSSNHSNYHQSKHLQLNLEISCAAVDSVSRSGYIVLFVPSIILAIINRSTSKSNNNNNNNNNNKNTAAQQHQQV